LEGWISWARYLRRRARVLRKYQKTLENTTQGFKNEVVNFMNKENCSEKHPEVAMDDGDHNVPTLVLIAVSRDRPS
jgi:hypothetical protein